MYYMFCLYNPLLFLIPGGDEIKGMKNIQHSKSLKAILWHLQFFIASVIHGTAFIQVHA